MELSWLEDLLTVAEKGHFARAAHARNVSQSALTRRIQSLERWVGAELLDRSAHPIRLTRAGEKFSVRARDIVGRAAEAKAELRETESHERSVRIACLHSLALTFAPQLVSELQSKLGAFQATVIAETRTVNEYLHDLQSARADLFLCYAHPSVPLGINMDGFPQVRIAEDVFAPFVRAGSAPIDLSDPDGDPIPYLQYSASAFMSRIADHVIVGAEFEHRLRPVYRATLAESLCSAAQAGMGMGWAPRKIAQQFTADPPLRELDGPWRADLAISAVRSAGNTRPIVSEIWSVLAGERKD